MTKGTKNPTLPYAVVGLVLSCYAVYVEHKVSHKSDDDNDEDFTALCDIEQLGASCRYVHYRTTRVERNLLND